MLLGCIADDFTGAGDLANTLAKEGLRTRLYVGAPPPDALECEAGVIALKSRSVPSGEAVSASIEALTLLRGAGCRQFFFKYCSTFDSTPDGNIGPVAEAMASALGGSGVVVCPAFPATGRTLYNGHLFVNDLLLSESGMEHHPLTPMTDPDIRRWLAAQCTASIGHVGHRIVRRGPAAIGAALREQADLGKVLVVVDAVHDDDLRAIGTASADAILLTGGSGLALGLASNFRAAGITLEGTSGFRPSSGRAAILAGSCSSTTRAQIDVHRLTNPTLAIDVGRLLRGDPVLEEATAFVQDNQTSTPLVYSSVSPDAIGLYDTETNADAAEAVERLFASLAGAVSTAGVRRLIVAGGETSGAVVTSLGLRVLDVGPEIDPGVPALSAKSVEGATLSLALKSGNFGAPDFFAKAAARLETEIG